MPTIAREGPYRVFFFSADRAEPAHVHVQRDRQIAKLWLHDLTVADAGGFSAPELARIVALVRDRRSTFLERWNEHLAR